MNVHSNEQVSQPALQMQQGEQATFGMQLVGINFNPSGDPKVNKAKELCAQLADLVKSDYDKEGHTQTELKTQLYNHTIGEILNAQMCAVKLLTLKY